MPVNECGLGIPVSGEREKAPRLMRCTSSRKKWGRTDYIVGREHCHVAVVPVSGSNDNRLKVARCIWCARIEDFVVTILRSLPDVPLAFVVHNKDSLKSVSKPISEGFSPAIQAQIGILLRRGLVKPRWYLTSGRAQGFRPMQNPIGPLLSYYALLEQWQMISQTLFRIQL